MQLTLVDFAAFILFFRRVKPRVHCFNNVARLLRECRSMANSQKQNLRGSGAVSRKKANLAHQGRIRRSKNWPRCLDQQHLSTMRPSFAVASAACILQIYHVLLMRVLTKSHKCTDQRNAKVMLVHMYMYHAFAARLNINTLKYLSSVVFR